jgi:glycosyltransferase involved in cell wall biosynthesis/GT2 family glycosyltransferase
MGSEERRPFISVVMAVYNGAATLERALQSVQAQSFADWELLVVDDASSDDTLAVLEEWARREPRTRVFRHQQNSGPSAGRNTAFRHARGDFICYLDHDDEYYPDYLAHVWQTRDKGDVLMFGYDQVGDDGQTKGKRWVWDPVHVAGDLFLYNIVSPLGVAHRRSLLARVGGFNELLWREGDWDFWRRLARAGAKFAYVGHKSGLYHIRSRSISRVPHLTRHQRETVQRNWAANRPIFEQRSAGARSRKARSILFASPYCLADYTSGAAVATHQALEFLNRVDFRCQAFCGSRMDAPQDIPLDEILARQKGGCGISLDMVGFRGMQKVETFQGKIPLTICHSTSLRTSSAGEQDFTVFLRAYEEMLVKQRPDVLLTYGGDEIARALIKLAKKRDIPVVFCLHNCAYRDPAPFKCVDYVIVPSEFSRHFYWNMVGVACLRLPNVIDRQRVEPPSREPRYVTFVNPQPTKGLYMFARIAEVLAQRRPEIPLMVVEGRSACDWRQQTGIDLGRLGNVTSVAATDDPRSFYATTRLLLMPSLCNESFGLVAAEGMINGIPVLASNRGALPETIGHAGFLFDIPRQCTPKSNTLPTAAEVAPWVETIIRLWDDASLYAQASRSARDRAQQWQPERIASVYEEFFSNIFPQPGPPLVPIQRRPSAQTALVAEPPTAQ